MELQPESLILTIDLGNTAMKASVFEGSRLVQSIVSDDSDPDAIRTLLTFHSVEGIVMCSTGQDRLDIAETLRRENVVPFLELSHDTPLPIRVEYSTPGTLGLDRVAAAVAAADICGAALVVDLGTAVTADLVADGAFRGGNISPGLRLRFRSLNRFTSKLPLVCPQGDIPDFGDSTETAIRSGVVRGLVAEISDDYRLANEEIPGLALILTGGDAEFIAPLLRSRGLDPVVDRSLLGKGLVRIFNFNHSGAVRQNIQTDSI